jgi:tripartite-type tricarboxylate transporter receptor subunit TctC
LTSDGLHFQSGNPHIMHSITRLLSLACTSIAIAYSVPALAQGSYPTKPIRIIVPCTAGGSADFMARMIGQRLTDTWKEQVLVENRVGAGGNLGMEAAQKSPPDGHTLVMIDNSQAINESLYSKLRFVLLKADVEKFGRVVRFASIKGE